MELARGGSVTSGATTPSFVTVSNMLKGEGHVGLWRGNRPTILSKLDN